VIVLFFLKDFYICLQSLNVAKHWVELQRLGVLDCLEVSLRSMLRLVVIELVCA